MSSDQTTIAYDSDESGNGDIYQLELTTQTSSRLTDSPEVEMHPIFSPDGKSIAFARQSNGYQHIWIMKADGSQQTPITQGQVLDDPASFSGDGQALIFVRSTYFSRVSLPKRELFSVSPSNTNYPAKRLGGYVAIAPDFTIALSNVYHTDTQRQDLWLVKMNTSQTRFIGPGSAPNFSAESDRMLYLIQAPDYRHDVVLKELDNGEGKAIPFPPGYKLYPAFCRRGTAVIVRMPSTERDGVGGVYITDLQTLKTERISTIPGGKL